MNLFSRFFKKQSEGKDQKASAPQQAVFVYLKGTGLPDSVYQDYDLATLEDQLIEVIEQNDLGEFDGNESWGYNPSFHMALDKYYGTPTAFKQLIDECHKMGLLPVLPF